MAKRLWKIAVLLLLATIVVAGWRMPTANATNPSTVSFQGKMTNANGTNVADGTYTFVFKLYSASSGGSALWAESDSLSVTAGVFQVNLGANCPFFTANACNGSTPIDFSTASSLYLGITFNSDPAGEMSPRVQLQSVPYAYYADNADKVGGLTSSQLVQLGPSSAQSLSSANPAIYINDTGGGNLLQLQNATDKFVVGSTGNVTAAGNLMIQGSSNSINGSLSIGTNTAPSNVVDILAANGGARLYSNASGAFTYLALDRTGAAGSEGILAVAAAANQFVSGSASGDLILRNAVGNLLLTASNSAIGLKIDSAGNGAFAGNLTAVGGTFTGQITDTVTLTAAGTASTTTLTVQPASAPGSSVAYNGIAASTTTSGTNVNGNVTVRGVYGGVGNGSSTTLGTAEGVRGQIFSSGNITNVLGVVGSIVNAGSGTFGTTAALAAMSPVSNGTITTNYGLLIQSQKATGITTAYGIGQIGANDLNYLAGNTAIGYTSAPTSLTNPLSVGTAGQFNVSSAGAVTAVGVNSGTGLLQGTGGLVIAGGTISLNVSSNNAVNIGTGTTTSAVSIGGGSNTISLGSSTTLATGKTLTVNGDAFTDLTGTGLQNSSNALSVVYGSTAGTAVQGNVTFTCAGAGTNLSGGGTTITEGSGGTCANLAVINNPTFSGLITGQAGLTVVGATNINASGTAATNIGTGSSGAVTIGGGSNTFALSSTGLDITTAGAITGASNITASGTVQGATISATSSYVAEGTAGQTFSCGNNQYANQMVVIDGIVTSHSACSGVGLSDIRLKTAINSLPDDTLSQLVYVNPVTFQFDCSNSYFADTDTYCPTATQTGVIAQQLQQIFPQLVNLDEFGYYHVDYQGLSVEALKGVSELAQHINAAGDANLNSIISSSLTSDGALSLDSGSTGDVSIDTGSAANVNVGTGLAGAVNLSRTGQTTTVNGALLVDQAGDFAGDVTIGGNLTLSGSGFGLVGDNGQTVVSFDRSGNASFAGSLNLASASVSGGLTIGGEVTVGGLSTFQKLATFLARTVFRQDVEFDGHITVASDSAGYAALRSGESSVHVSFTAPYDNPPVVTASIVNGQFSLVSVNNVTAQGFDLSLSQPAAADTLLSWTALGVTNPQTAANPVPTP